MKNKRARSFPDDNGKKNKRQRRTMSMDTTAAPGMNCCTRCEKAVLPLPEGPARPTTTTPSLCARRSCSARMNT